MAEFVEPTIGRIVIYRSHEDVSMPAIVTGLPPEDDDGVQRHVFLHVFPPPGQSGLLAFDRQWGIPWTSFPGDPGTWSWPERA